MKSNKFRKGYQQIPNSVLDQLFNKDATERQRMLIYLCILKHAFFRDGSIRVNKFRYTCHQDEWLTTYSELSHLTGIKRSLVRKLLEQLQEMRYIEVTCNKRFTSIRLTETAPVVRPSEAPVWKTSRESPVSPSVPSVPTTPSSAGEPLAVSDLTQEDLMAYITKGGEQ